MRIMLIALVMVVAGGVLLAKVAPPVGGEFEQEQPREKLITLNVRDTDLRSVLTMVFNQAGVNYTIANNVQGSVTAYIEGQTLDSALRVVLSPLGFTWRKDGSIYMVAMKQDALPPSTPPVEFFEDSMFREPVKEQDIRIEKIPLNYIDAYELKALLEGGSPRSSQNAGRLGSIGLGGLQRGSIGGFGTGYGGPFGSVYGGFDNSMYSPYGNYGYYGGYGRNSARGLFQPGSSIIY